MHAEQPHLKIITEIPRLTMKDNDNREHCQQVLLHLKRYFNHTPSLMKEATYTVSALMETDRCDAALSPNLSDLRLSYASAITPAALERITTRNSTPSDQAQARQALLQLRKESEKALWKSLDATHKLLYFKEHFF